MARLARIVSGRRSRWACPAVWLVLIGVFGALGAKINNFTDKDIALPSASQSNQVQELDPVLPRLVRTLDSALTWLVGERVWWPSSSKRT